MSSTRKSKKGFQKLENHELAEFTALGNGAGIADSGSETDLLDLTGVEGEPRGRWSSCCCWCSALYFGVLTCLVVLVGLYCGYLTFNLWQAAESTAMSHDNMDSRMANMEAELKHYEKEISAKCSTLEQELSALKSTLNQTAVSLQAMHVNMENSLDTVRSKVKAIDKRLHVLESEPKEVLIKQVDSINRDMGLMNASMRQLNMSLADIKEVKTQVVSLESVMNSHDDQLRAVKEGIGEVRQNNQEMRDSVDAAVSTTAGFKSRLDSVDSSLTSSNDQMKQTTDLLSAQVTSVQVSMNALNDSLNQEMNNLKGNVAMLNSSLENLAVGVTGLQEELVVLQNQTPDSSIESVSEKPTPSVKPTIKTSFPEEEVTTTEQPSNEPTTTEPTESTTASSVSTTTLSPPKPTDFTGATEDSVPIDSEINEKGTPLSVVDQEIKLAEDEVEIERDMVIVGAEVNKTKDAIDLLQSLADKFNSYDLDDSGTLSIMEFNAEIPTQHIFSLLDTDKDEELTYKELQTNIDSLRVKLNELKRELKTLQGLEVEVEEESQEVAEVSDPYLQKKLMDLYKYIMHPQSE